MKRTITRREFLTLATLGLCAGMPVAAPGNPARDHQDALAVLPFTIKSTSPQADPSQAEFVHTLAQTAAKRAAHAATRRGLASKVERVDTRPECGPEFRTVLTGEVRLPVNLAPEEAGTRAAFRKGDFAFAVIRLEDADGKLLSEANVKLRWDEVRWLRGSRPRRVRPVADVLEDAVEKLVDRGVAQLPRRNPSGIPNRK